jgi:hypothetical protein
LETTAKSEFKEGDWVRCTYQGITGQLKQFQQSSDYPLYLGEESYTRFGSIWTDTETVLVHLTPLEKAML